MSNTPPTLDLRVVSAWDILELRARVLRPGQPQSAAMYDIDEHADTIHVGAYDSDTLIGCATLMVEPGPMSPDTPALRLRGMAVSDTRRRQGVGCAVLEFAIEHAQRLHPTHRLLWFNARHIARAFYLSLGFEPWGEDFTIPSIGPHTVMWKTLD